MLDFGDWRFGILIGRVLEGRFVVRKEAFHSRKCLRLEDFFKKKFVWCFFDSVLSCISVQIDENVQREIINHQSLRHPNIVRFKEVIQQKKKRTID